MSDEKPKPWYSVYSWALSVIILTSFLMGHFMGDRIIPAWTQFMDTLFSAS